jgi:hypothetical protein
MNSAIWTKLKGTIGEEPKNKMFQIMHDNGAYIPYVTENKQGDCIYTVLGDALTNVLYMSVRHDDEVFVGSINSPTEERMIDKTPKMHQKDADLMHFMSDMLISVFILGISEDEVFESWDDVFLS